MARSADEANPPESANCALVPLAPAAAAHAPLAVYRQAPFLAHLIATRQQHPQTRARRRAEPTEAQAAYRAMAMFLKR